MSVEKMERRSMDAKIAERSDLSNIVRQLREQDGDSTPRIVFTNGCFDMLHEGHVQYLRDAAKLGDLLIVAMNDDEGIRRLKGPTRPLLPLRERLKVMAAMRMVDYVTWFDEETPIPMLRELMPDLLVKGGDYPVTGVVGHDIVGEWGGEARVLSVVEGRSTTDIEARLKAAAAAKTAGPKDASPKTAGQ